LPIRWRLTLAAVAGVAVIVTALSCFVYVRMSRDLLDTVDAGLRSRSEVLASEVRTRGPSLPHGRATLIETDEGFAQTADASGVVLDSSPIVEGSPLVPPSQLVGLDAPTLFDERVSGIDNVARVLAVPVDIKEGRYVLLVGTSLQDRRDEMLQLAATLAVAGVALVALLGGGVWWLTGAALEPVERMRRQAEAITSADRNERLTVGEGEDELSRLGNTLNAMLDRVEEATRHERELIDLASHELRTPLAIQRVGLDLALSGPQTVEELRGGLEDASSENTHLARIANDLLVLARGREGRLAVHRRDVSLRGTLDDAVARHGSRAAESTVSLSAEAPDRPVRLDPDWIRQAVDDLLDNALRATPRGGRIALHAAVDDGHLGIVVENTGPGFDDSFLPHAFDAFRSHNGSGGAGLGLAIVRAIAEAHGGTASAENTSDGARVTMTMPAS
jgi:signal transduction histidine kinase